MEIISKCEAAKRWKLSKSAVSKYCLLGMPVRSDGRLDWPAVDEWRSRYVGFEPTAPVMAREAAKAQRGKAVNRSGDETVEEARQRGRWEMHQALIGPAAMERTVKVLLKLGFTPKHALQAAFWFYLSPSECDDVTERDLDGQGEIFEPDWLTMLPTGKPLDVERVTVAVELAMTKLFNPEQLA